MSKQKPCLNTNWFYFFLYVLKVVTQYSYSNTNKFTQRFTDKNLSYPTHFSFVPTLNLCPCLKGKLSWAVNLKKTAWTFQVWFKAASMQGKTAAYDGPLAAKEITPDKRADSVNEKWSENLACCHKRIYLNACVAHDSFPLNNGRSLLYWQRLERTPIVLNN